MSSIVLKRPVHSRIFLSNCEGLYSAGTRCTFPAAKATGVDGGTDRPTAQWLSAHPHLHLPPSPQPRLHAGRSASPPSQVVPSQDSPRTLGPRAAGGTAATVAGQTRRPRRREGPPRGFSVRSWGATEDAPQAEAQGAPDSREHVAPLPALPAAGGGLLSSPARPAPPRGAPRGDPGAQLQPVARAHPLPLSAPRPATSDRGATALGGPIPSRAGPRGRPASAGKLSKQIHHLLRLLPAAGFKGISSYRVETRCHQAFTLWFHWLAPRESI